MTFSFLQYGQQAPPTYAYQMVRTDSKEQKLDAFVIPKSLQQDSQSVTEMYVSPDNTHSMSTGTDFLNDTPDSSLGSQSGERSPAEQLRGQSSLVGQKRKHTNSIDGGGRHGSNTSGVTQPFRQKFRRKEVKLTSVKSLQLAVRGQQHKG